MPATPPDPSADALFADPEGADGGAGLQALPWPQAIKGRGSAWAIAHRFERDQREVVDDGWGSLDQQVSEQSLPPETQVIEEQARSILSSNQSPDIVFDLSINPYRGCEHVMWNSSSRRTQTCQRGPLCPDSFDPKNIKRVVEMFNL